MDFREFLIPQEPMFECEKRPGLPRMLVRFFAP